jgi:hypothetical protein
LPPAASALPPEAAAAPDVPSKKLAPAPPAEEPKSVALAAELLDCAKATSGVAPNTAMAAPKKATSIATITFFMCNTKNGDTLYKYSYSMIKRYILYKKRQVDISSAKRNTNKLIDLDRLGYHNIPTIPDKSIKSS